jgi:hypothetical protein
MSDEPSDQAVKVEPAGDKSTVTGADEQPENEQPEDDA